MEEQHMNNNAFVKIESLTIPKVAMPSGSMSISKTGRIGLSREFVDEYGVGSDSRAILYWKDSSKTVAIAFVSGEPKPTTGSFAKVQATDGYSVAFVGSGGAGYIIAGGFFKELGIDPAEHLGFYEYEELDADDAGITDGGKTVFVVTLK
jgi:hypothetical protein